MDFMRGFGDEGGASKAPAYLTPMSPSVGRTQNRVDHIKRVVSLEKLSFHKMNSPQQYALELALRYFEINSDSPLTERDLRRFDWLMSKPLAEWQYLGLTDQRPRRGVFVPPNPADTYYR
jgi:hypothetical protein